MGLFNRKKKVAAKPAPRPSRGYSSSGYASRSNYQPQTGYGIDPITGLMIYGLLASDGTVTEERPEPAAEVDNSDSYDNSDSGYDSGSDTSDSGYSDSSSSYSDSSSSYDSGSSYSDSSSSYSSSSYDSGSSSSYDSGSSSYDSGGSYDSGSY